MKLEPSFTQKTEAQSATRLALKAVILLRSEAERAELAAALKPLEHISFQMMLRVSPAVRSLMQGDGTPDVLLVDVDASNSDDLDLLRELKANARATGTPIVALIDGAIEAGALRAIRAGADDIILKPIDVAEAQEVMARVAGRHHQGAVFDAKLGGAIAFLHVTGGAGATTLAINAATMLAEKVKDGQVCLIDLDIQYGNAAGLLDLSGYSPIEVLVDDPKRLDREMLESMMVKHSSGLRVLTAPRLPFPLNAYSSETVRRLIEIAKRRFAYVVIDLPVALTPWTDIVLRETEFNYLVCSPSVASVHRVVQFLKLVEHEELTNLPLKIIVNGHQVIGASTDITLSQFAKTIGREIDYTFADDRALISMSHNHGHPAVQIKPDGKFAVQLSNMLAADLQLPSLVMRRSSWLPFGRG